MEIEYDQLKNIKNIASRGISFELAYEFQFETAWIFADERKNYGEIRLITYGFIGTRVFVLCFKTLGSDSLRVISLREANEREIKKYTEFLRKSH